MFIIEDIVGDGGVLECIILNGVPNSLSAPLIYMKGRQNISNTSQKNTPHFV